jgi:Tfp pilus assembly protein PilX
MRSSFSSLKRARGSVLVFSLIILSFLLIASISLATVALSGTRATSALNRSSVAFQAADAGSELTLQKIYAASCDTSRLSCLGSCSSGRIEGTVGNASYDVNFYDTSGTRITDCNSTSWRADVETLLSEGAFGGTTRAVQVEVKHAE